MSRVFINRYGDLRAGWKILSVILINLILSVVLSSIFIMIPISNAENVITMYGGQIVFVISIWIALKWIDKKDFKDIGLIAFRVGARDFLWGLLFGAAWMTLIFVILFIAGEVTLANSLSNPIFSSSLWSGLLLFVIVGFMEEIVFRGYFMMALQQMNRKWVTVLISALLFALAHGGNPNVSLLGVVNVFIVGLLFAFMFIKTGNLWMPIGFHITWNYFQGSIFGFPVSGNAPDGVYNIDEVGSAIWTGGAFGPEGGLLTTILLGVGFLVVWRYPARLDVQNGIFSSERKTR